MNDLSKKINVIDKSLLGYKIISDDRKLYKAQRLIAAC